MFTTVTILSWLKSLKKKKHYSEVEHSEYRLIFIIKM